VTQIHVDDVSDNLFEFDEEDEEDGEADDDDADMQVHVVVTMKKTKPGVVSRFFNKFFQFIWILFQLLLALFIIAVILCLVIVVAGGAPLDIIGGTPWGTPFGAVAAGYQTAFAPILAPVLAPLGVHASAAGVWMSQTAWPAIIGFFTR